jgi:glycosyltransferase involved in cell wall biosynthesis
MNILHVIPGLSWARGGPSAVVRGLARHQTEAGHTVTVLTTDQGVRSGEKEMQLEAPVVVERLKVQGPDRLAYTPGFGRRVRAHLRTADVAHIHSIFTYPVHVALRECKAAGVPIVLRPCGLLHPYSLGRSRLQKRLYLALWGRRVKQTCSAWHYTSAEEAKESWPQDSSPRFVLPNGIEPADFSLDRVAAQEKVWRSLPDLGGSRYVLFLGRLHAKKRLDILLEAFLAGAPQSYKLVIAGPDSDGIWPNLAARLLDARGSAGRVVRVGMVTGSAKAQLLAGASLFALPSEHENFGVAALEALASGTPVLLSPHVDFLSILQEANLGQGVPLEVNAWREQLARLLVDEANLARIGTRAREWVGHHFAWSKIAAELVHRYQWVIGGCREAKADTSYCFSSALVP